MGEKGCKILYIAFYAKPLRIVLKPSKIKRIQELQKKLSIIKLRRNEEIIAELPLRFGLIKVDQEEIDVGIYSYEVWESFFRHQLKIGEMQRVSFSEMFLAYLEKGDPRFKSIIQRKDKEFLVWKKLEA